MPDMAEKLGVGTDVRELKIGQSFSNQRKADSRSSRSGSSSRSGALSSPRNDKGKDSSYHTIRYDFKPASSNTSSAGHLEVDEHNGVAVKIPHEGGGETNFSGHQKEANVKDCLLIIDHATGEITLEKLSSQILVKKTRAEKPEQKNNHLESSANITPSNSRPHTPVNSANQDSVGCNKTSTARNKASPRGNSSLATKNVPNHADIRTSASKSKVIDNLSSASSSEYSTDSDSDMDVSSAQAKGSIVAATSGTIAAASRTGSKSSGGVVSSPNSKRPSQSTRVSIPNIKEGGRELKQINKTQSTSKCSRGESTVKQSDLNDQFDDSDDSDIDEESNSGGNEKADYSLKRFTATSVAPPERNTSNSNQHNSKSGTTARNRQQLESKLNQSKDSSNAAASDNSAAIQSMPEFLNDDLELSESDSDN